MSKHRTRITLQPPLPQSSHAPSPVATNGDLIPRLHRRKPAVISLKHTHTRWLKCWCINNTPHPRAFITHVDSLTGWLAKGMYARMSAATGLRRAKPDLVAMIWFAQGGTIIHNRACVCVSVCVCTSSRICTWQIIKFNLIKIKLKLGNNYK